MKRSIVLFSALWVAHAAAQSAIAQAPQPPPAPVDVDAVRIESVAPVSWTPGSVISRADADVAGEVAGRLSWVAEIGSILKQGDPVARIDDRLLKLALEEARAARARILAQRDYAQAQQNRMSQLVAQGTISRSQADEQAAEVGMREQELKAADVAVRQAQLRLEQASIRAPFAGMVAARLLEAGEYLVPGSAVARLVDTARPEVLVRAPVALAEHVRAGQPLGLRQGERLLQGSLRAFVPVGDAQSRQFELRITLDSDAPAIGTALEVALPTGLAREAITVSRDALVLRPGERYVVRVGAENASERINVDVGGAHGDRVEVEGALQPGDILVVRGAERLRPGQIVVARTPAAEQAAMGGGKASES